MRTRRISMRRRAESPLPPRVSASAALLVLLAIPSLTSAFTIRNPLVARSQVLSPSEDLLARSSSCGDSTYVQCGSSFPSDFCCPSTSTCISLAGGTTALCCPTGSNCTQIETIPCELSLEDKSQHPAAVVMTTALTGTLETCGSQCCPFGYSCTSDNVCEENSDQSVKPSTSSVASSATSTASSGSQTSSGSSATVTAAVSPTSGSGSSATGTSGSGSGSDGSSTASAAADSTSTSDAAASSSTGASSAHAGIVAGGVIGGIAAAVCLGLIILFFVKREMKRKQQGEKGADDGNSDSRSSSFGNILSNPVTRGGSTRAPISKPIPHDEGTLRSDFSRKVTPHTGSFDADADAAGAAGLGVNHEYYGGGGQSSEKSGAAENGSDDELGEMRGSPRSPPGGVASPNMNPRAVSSLYGELYRDTTRRSDYPGPLKMPSARQYGGFEPAGGMNPVSEYGGSSSSGPGSGSGGRGSPTAAYINVFADENALSPHSLAPPPPPGRFADGQPGDRETRFSDFGRQI